MTDQSAEQLSDWIDAAPPPKRRDPGQYVCSWRPLSPVATAASLVLSGGGYWWAQGRGIEWATAYILVCVTVGLMLTLAGTAWGSMIALTESGTCGTLFVMFPPYMFYYAATRWRWMSQPTILFVCGLGLAIASMLLGSRLLGQLTSG